MYYKTCKKQFLIIASLFFLRITQTLERVWVICLRVGE